MMNKNSNQLAAANAARKKWRYMGPEKAAGLHKLGAVPEYKYKGSQYGGWYPVWPEFYFLHFYIFRVEVQPDE